MKLKLFLLLVLVAVLVGDALGEKPRKLKKVRRHRTTSTTTTESEVSASEEEKDVISMLESDEEALVKEKEEKEREEKERLEKELREELLKDQPPVQDNEVFSVDPCLKKHCGAGQICDINEEGEAECVCIPSCPQENDPRRKVCSNHNETWQSDCEIYQMRCWCLHGHEGCKKEEYKHVHIEYYGLCREMPDCAGDEMSDFPRRMREWLFNIMRDLADREELSAHYLKMEREAETNYTRRWANAAVWKWCELDGHPHDRSVSRHELFPVRAPLMALEHCIAPFLDSCDEDDDHRINLREWGKCLELELDDLEEKCDELMEG